MKKVLLSLFFSVFFIGCGGVTPVVTKTEFVEFPLPIKYEVNDLKVKVYKENIRGKTYILMSNEFFIEIYKRYQLYKTNYNNLYNSIVEYNTINKGNK